ncbi:MAG: hypothetical protein IPK63_17780 [Candidatus Competibacteraceae bacterium]|nr:hypothetical protein [Candidatus Competibacteraceae bacterium]
MQVTLQQVVPASYYDNELVRDTVAVNDRTGEPVTVYRRRRRPSTSSLLSGQSARLRQHRDGDRDRRGSRRNPGGGAGNQPQRNPGLGDKIELSKSDWISRFTGRSLADPQPDQWAVKRMAACSINLPGPQSPARGGEGG